MKIALIILFISWLIEKGCINYLFNNPLERLKYCVQKGFIFWLLGIVQIIHIISLVVVVINLIFMIF